MADQPTHHRQYPRGPGYDEQGALQRLEQLRRDIQTARWRREQAVAEFDAFIANFRETAGPRPVALAPETIASAPAADAAVPPAASPFAAPMPGGPAPPAMRDASPGAAMRDASPGGKMRDASPVAHATGTGAPAFESSPTLDPAAPVPSSASEGDAATAPGSEAFAPLALPAARRGTTRHRVVVAASVAAGLALVAAAGFLAFRSGAPGSPRATDAATVATAPASAPDPPSAVAPPPPAASATAPSLPASSAAAPPAPAAAPPIQPGTLRLELVARNAVWIRVTVDGRRLIEREVPAGFRRTIDAERGVAIRAGNAAALLVGENGAAPAPLGREGQVLTRIFSSPADR